MLMGQAVSGTAQAAFGRLPVDVGVSEIWVRVGV